MRFGWGWWYGVLGGLYQRMGEVGSAPLAEVSYCSLYRRRHLCLEINVFVG